MLVIMAHAIFAHMNVRACKYALFVLLTVSSFKLSRLQVHLPQTLS
jgi:hypothetical protein